MPLVPTPVAATARASCHPMFRLLLAACTLLGAHAAWALAPEIRAEAIASTPGQSVDFSQVEPNATAGMRVDAIVETLLSTQPAVSVSALVAGGAQFGSLGASSFVRAVTNAGNGGPFSALGTASWRDSVVIDAPGLTGQAGVFRASLLLDGAMSTTASGQDRAHAQVALALRRGDTNDRSFASFVSLPGSGWLEANLAGVSAEFTLSAANQVRDFVAAPVVFDVRFVFGQALDFGITLRTRASLSTFGATGLEVVANSDFRNTLVWNGISQVSLPGGAAVAGYTVQTVSGFDFASPVPEASSLWLLALGLAGIGLRMTRLRAA